MGIGSVRRYYLLKVRFHEEMEEGALAAVFRAKFLEAPGVPLPDDFPSLAKLAAAAIPMTTIEDVRGADVRELVKYAGLTRAEAASVLAAIEDL